MPNCTPRTGGHNCPVARQINILPLLLATPHFADRCRLYDGFDFWKLYGYGPLWILRLVVTEPKMRPYLFMKLQHNCCFGTRNIKKQVFWNKEQRELSKENTSLRSVKTASMQVAQLLRRISPKPRCTFFKPSISSEPSLDFDFDFSMSDFDGFRDRNSVLKNIEDVPRDSERCPSFSVFRSVFGFRLRR